MSAFYDLLLAKKLSGGGVAPTPSESLAGTKWKLNTHPAISTKTYNIVFDCSGKIYNQLYLNEAGGHYYIVYRTNGTNNEVYADSWGNSVMRTITIVGGADVENAELIAWLKANAVQQS